MALQFTKEEVEQQLRDILDHGDIRRIAVKTGISEKYLAKQLDPHNVRKSHTFIHLQIQSAIDEIDPKKGEKFFRATKQFRELSVMRRLNKMCANEQTGNLMQEFTEFIQARLENKDFIEQLNELLDIEKIIPAVKQALFDERNKKHFGEEE